MPRKKILKQEPPFGHSIEFMTPKPEEAEQDKYTFNNAPMTTKELHKMLHDAAKKADMKCTLTLEQAATMMAGLKQAADIYNALMSPFVECITNPAKVSKLG